MRKERIHITIDRDVYGRLRQLAGQSKMSISTLVNSLLKQILFDKK